MNAYQYLKAVEAEFIQTLLSEGAAHFDPSVARPPGVSSKQMGPVVSNLARAGLIEKVGAVSSGRASRHGGLLNYWRVADREGLSRRLRSLPNPHVLKAQRPAGEQKQGVFPLFDRGGEA